MRETILTATEEVMRARVTTAENTEGESMVSPAQGREGWSPPPHDVGGTGEGRKNELKVSTGGMA